MKKAKLSYLTVEVVNALSKRFPEIKRLNILRIVCLSLGHSTIKSLRDSYHITNEGIIKERHEDLHNGFYDISRLGWVFNATILKNHFKISKSEAKRIKLEFDRYLINQEYYDGNINYSDLSLVKFGIRELFKENQARLMAYDPINFYCRRVENHPVKYLGKKLSISFIYFDGISLDSERNFYGGRKIKQIHINELIKDFIDLFLKYDNIVILKMAYRFHLTNETPFFDFILKTYDHYFIKNMQPDFYGGQDFMLIQGK